MSRKPIDLTGKRFGRLEVIEKAETRITPKGKNVYMWKCRCDCGNEIITSANSLKNGYTQSCGCLQKERAFNYNFIDISGQRFGRLTAVEPKGKGKDNSVLWLCKCDCGNFNEVTITKLKNGHTKSCGCLLRNRIDDIKTEEQKKEAKRIRTIWKGMKQRCYNLNSADYENYGARGIKVCKEWADSFESFYKWSITHGYERNLTIDRRNNNGDYEPSNCRWVTVKVQANNTRRNIKIEYSGKSHTISEWAEMLKVKRSILDSEMKKYGRNKTIEKYLNKIQ